MIIPVEGFEPLVVSGNGLNTDAALRSAHALEHVASRLDSLPRILDALEPLKAALGADPKGP
jgi:hypothetical protein